MYLVDANVLITANNAHYGMDFAPGFWDWLDEQHEAGTVASIAKVRDELLDPELADWAEAHPGFFKPADGTTQGALTSIASWAVGNQQYSPAAKATFLAAADYFLVAQASTLGATVVTHEKPAPDAKKQIKIPDACKAAGVEYCLPWQMLRDAGANFWY